MNPRSYAFQYYLGFTPSVTALSCNIFEKLSSPTQPKKEVTFGFAINHWHTLKAFCTLPKI